MITTLAMVVSCVFMSLCYPAQGSFNSISGKTVEPFTVNRLILNLHKEDHIFFLPLQFFSVPHKGLVNVLGRKEGSCREGGGNLKLA